jgi:hypothetical protein
MPRAREWRWCGSRAEVVQLARSFCVRFVNSGMRFVSSCGDSLRCWQWCSCGLTRGEVALFESGGGQVWVLVLLLLIHRSVVPGRFVSLSFLFPVFCHCS